MTANQVLRVVAVAGLMMLPAAAEAQTTNVEVEPINCWWRTPASGVRMGETFQVVLTCAVIETESTRIVADQSRLEPNVVQLPPYEVTGGARGADLRTAGRRFFQYTYHLRLISEDTFGQPVDIPSLTVNYTVEQRAQEGEAVRGREQSYAMPTLPLQVISLVPETARDIREPAGVTFQTVAAREFRGDAMRVGGGVLIGLGVLMLVVMLIRAIAQGRTTSRPAQERLLSDSAVMSGVRKELAAIRAESRGGWSAELAGRLLASARLTAAMGLGRSISRRRADGGTVLEGQIRVRRVLVSGSATADHVRAAQGAVAARVAGLDDALEALSAARYGNAGTIDDSAMNEALEAAERAASRVAAQHTWFARMLANLKKSIVGQTSRVWAR